MVCRATHPKHTDMCTWSQFGVLTVYVSSDPVGVVLVSGLLDSSAMPCPDDMRSRLYVPSVVADTVA